MDELLLVLLEPAVEGLPVEADCACQPRFTGCGMDQGRPLKAYVAHPQIVRHRRATHGSLARRLRSHQELLGPAMN